MHDVIETSCCQISSAMYMRIYSIVMTLRPSMIIAMLALCGTCAAEDSSGGPPGLPGLPGSRNMGDAMRGVNMQGH